MSKTPEGAKPQPYTNGLLTSNLFNLYASIASCKPPLPTAPPPTTASTTPLTNDKLRTTNSTMTKKSKYQFIKEGWGNRINFQASYGLNMTPDDIEEGNAILEALMNGSDVEEGEYFYA